jgi:type IX secretion system PorP/SprF family membrane protein
MKMLKHIWLSVLLLAGYASQAQDLHLSQFFASPLTLNPAETGNLLEDYRLGGNFKNQWAWANDKNYNYRTFSAYADVALLKGTLPKGDWIGAGLVILHDNAGSGRLSVTKIFASAAYHKMLGRAKKYYLSIGVNGGYIQKGIDYDRLYFNSQWNDIVYDTQTPSGESGSDALRYFDMSAGLNFTMQVRPNVRLNIGGSAMHLLRPQESFYDAAENRLGIRPLAHAGANIRFNEHWHIEPTLLYMNQKSASEFLASMLTGYKLKGNGRSQGKHILYFGAIYRVNDALAPMIGYQFNRTRVIMNYDINLSSLTEASNGVGGFEISIVHTGFWPGSYENRSLPCPRM